MKSLTSALLLFLIAFAACNKEDKGEKMPPATKSGRHVLAFKVNGEVHVYQGKGGIPSSYTAYASVTNHNDGTWGLSIGASDSKYGDGIGINVDYHSKLEIGKRYTIYPQGRYQGSEYYYTKTSFRADSNKSYIIFTRADHVFAGQFEFYGVSKTGETIHLSEGIFDVTND